MRFDEARRYAPAQAHDGSREDELVALASTGAASELALAQSPHPVANAKTDHGDAAHLRTTLGDSATQLQYLTSVLGPWTLDSPIATALHWVHTKDAELAAAKPDDAAKWREPIAQQKAHLYRIASGVQQITSSGAGLDKASADAAPFRRILSTYAHAAGVSFLADSCERLIADAAAQQTALTVQALRATSTDLQQSVGQYEQTTQHSLDRRRFDDPQQLAADCIALQTKLVNGEAVDPSKLESTMLKSQEIALHAKIGAIRAQSAQLVAMAEKVGESKLSMIIAPFHGSFFTLSGAAEALEGELAMVEAAWQAEYKQVDLSAKPGPDRDAAMVDARRASLAAAQARFARIAAGYDGKGVVKFFTNAATVLRDQQEYTAIAAMCIELLVMIGVSFVASAAGGLVARAVGGMLARGAGVELAELSLGAQLVGPGMGAATEAGVNTIGQRALGDPDASFTENLLMTVGASAIMARIGKDLEFAKNLERDAGITWKTNRGAVILAETATITSHVVINVAVSYVAHMVADKLGGHREQATPTQLRDWFLQGASIAIGRKVHGRFAPRQELYEKLAKLRDFPRAKLLQGRGSELLRLAELAEHNPTGDSALLLSGKEVETLTEEKAVLHELDEHPELQKEAGLGVTDMAVARHQNREQLADIHVPGMESVPLVNAGLEDLGGGRLWAGTREQIGHAIDDARRAHLDVHETEDHGVHRVTIEGEAFEIHERDGAAGAKTKTESAQPVHTVPVPIARLSPVVPGQVYEGTEHNIDATFADLDARGIAARHEREASGNWRVTVGDRTFELRVVTEGPIVRHPQPGDSHEYQYDAMRPGPLSDRSVYDPKGIGNPLPASGFYGGKYDEIVLVDDLTLYRVGNGARSWGNWFTDQPLEGEAQYRIDVAVKRVWDDPKTGTMPTGSLREQKDLDFWSYTILIPKGTKVYVGQVGSQGGVHMGGLGAGQKQYFIPDAWKLEGKGGKVLVKAPFKRDGHIQPRPPVTSQQETEQ
ncbi:MAG TPA: hypothetical protein VMJ10_27305 [Kofleriaceae bacterium]|nr:hypothetical protein [Kofleriaceae bacterium]